MIFVCLSLVLCRVRLRGVVCTVLKKKASMILIKVEISKVFPHNELTAVLLKEIVISGKSIFCCQYQFTLYNIVAQALTQTNFNVFK